MFSRLSWLSILSCLGILFSLHASAVDYCYPQDVPASYGVTRISTFTPTIFDTCKSGFKYSAFPAFDSMQTCLGVPPAGFLNVSVMPSSGSCYGQDKSYVIRRPSDGMRVCSEGFQLPSGFVRTEGLASLQCGDTTWIYTNQYTLNVPRDGLWICDNQAPEGFTITTSQQNNVCVGRKTDSTFQYRLAGSSVSSPATSGVLKHISGLCVHPQGGSPNPANGTLAILEQPCTPEARIQYRMISGGIIQHVSSGKCLHPQGGSATPGNGTPLVFWDACTDARLRFEFTSAGSLRQLSSGKCLHPSGGSATPALATPLVFWDGCSDSSILKFTFVQ